MNEDRIAVGLFGTILSATGASLSVNEVQAIISIVVTILGFIISVILPLIFKLVKKIRDAKKDGKVTIEEIEDMTETGKEIIDETIKFIDEKTSEKKDKEEKL